MLFLTTRKLTLVTNKNVKIQKRFKNLYSSHDKEQDDTQFLQIGVTMAKL